MLSLGIVRIVGTYYSTCLRPIQPSAPARLSTSMKLKVDLVVPGGMEAIWKRVCPEADYAQCKTWVAVAEEKGKGLDAVRFSPSSALTATTFRADSPPHSHTASSRALWMRPINPPLQQRDPTPTVARSRPPSPSWIRKIVSTCPRSPPAASQSRVLEAPCSGTFDCS